ncbi:serine/threonine-protein kinase [Paenibacillus turpanensis]|uniref:serine/threonine-protein kinase n=1 Tax=Paenibacillus turpanensis TaxID=2689078 RepID=UPI00140D21EE|nr:serine/threonine-protein kinase [Paenibacillus turpanensis]
MKEETMLQPGVLVAGRYRVMRKLGQGGMCEVFLAEDQRLPGKHWAIKIPRMDVPFYSQVRQEAMLLATFQHPSLPQIADFIPLGDGARYAMVMEYIEGENLQQWFERKRREPSLQEVVDVAVQLCEALTYLHGQIKDPIIYRDVKPSNIMISREGRLKLIDFGTARQYKAGRAQDTVPLGTLAFASPEQLRGHQTDVRSDVYAVGTLLYYLLTRGSLYIQSVKSASQLHAKLSLKVSEVLRQALREDPQERFASIAALQAALVQAAAADLPGVAGGGLLRKQGSAGAYAAGVPTRTILTVGSLYSGAGATTTALLLAALLDRAGIPHAFVELPGSEPELMYRLSGGQPHTDEESIHPLGEDTGSTPKGTGPYQPWSADPMCTDHTHWYPAERGGARWEQTELYRLLASIKQPIVILDASGHLPDEKVRVACEASDLFWLVSGPDPQKLLTMRAQRLHDMMQSAKAAGKTAGWIAARFSAASYAAVMAEAFGLPPAAVIPELPGKELFRAKWNGDGRLHSLLKEEELRITLTKRLGELLGRDVSAWVSRMEKGGGLFKWIKKKHLFEKMG